MKSKKLFVVVLLVTILLMLLCVWIDEEKESSGIKSESVDFLEEIVRLEPLSMKKVLRETQEDMDAYLVQHPIVFLTNRALLDAGDVKNNSTLDYIVSLFQCTQGDFAITIIAHSDSNGSSSHNRQLSQKRADFIHHYISSRYRAKFINSIGYGEEFPLSTEENQTSNRRIEIKLRRVNNEL